MAWFIPIAAELAELGIAELASALGFEGAEAMLAAGESLLEGTLTRATAINGIKGAGAVWGGYTAVENGFTWAWNHGGSDIWNSFENFLSPDHIQTNQAQRHDLDNHGNLTIRPGSNAQITLAMPSNPEQEFRPDYNAPYSASGFERGNTGFHYELNPYRTNDGLPVGSSSTADIPETKTSVPSSADTPAAQPTNSNADTRTYFGEKRSDMYNSGHYGYIGSVSGPTGTSFGHNFDGTRF